MQGEQRGERAANWLTGRLFMTKMLVSAVALWGAGSYALGQIADATYGVGAAETYVEENGYTHVQLQRVDHFPEAILKDCNADTVEYEFTARNPDGAQIGVALCKRLGIEPKLIPEN